VSSPLSANERSAVIAPVSWSDAVQVGAEEEEGLMADLYRVTPPDDPVLAITPGPRSNSIVLSHPSSERPGSEIDRSCRRSEGSARVLRMKALLIVR
jgi:hypothetical protein